MHPSAALQIAFCGHLAKQGTMGGTTIKTTLTKIPRALAYLSGNPLEPAFAIATAAINVANGMARQIPVIHKVQRDPARATVLDKVWQDLTIPAMVRAACAVTYASGARGGNIFLTQYSASRRHMLIKWSDVQAKQDANGEKYFLLRIRKEKKAKRHVDSFQPVVLSRGNPGEMCPVEALAIAATESSSIGPHDAIFGSVTQAAVCKALNRHAAPGDRYTSHSLRQGMTTDLASTTASDRLVQIAGRWNSAESVKPYIRIMPQQRQNLNMQIRRAAQDDALQPAEPASEETPADSTQDDKSEVDLEEAFVDAESSDDSSCATALPRKNWPQLRRTRNPAEDEAPVNYLLSRTDEESWHVYFYDARTHKRTRYPEGGPPHKPHSRYTVWEGPEAQGQVASFFRSTNPVQPIPESQADQDINTLTDMYRECPYDLRVGALPERDLPQYLGRRC